MKPMPESNQILIDPGPSLYSHHTIAEAMMCLRRFGIGRYLEREGLETKREMSKPADIGAVIHSGLAHIYAQTWLKSGAEIDINGVMYGLADFPRFYSWKDAMNIAAISRGLDNATIETIEQTLEGYIRTILMSDTTRYDLVAIEKQYLYNVPGVTHGLSRRSQRADMVLWDRQRGKYFIVDHKKVWRLSAETDLQFAPHGQFMGYSIIGHRTWGDLFGGVILNRVCLPYKGGKPRFDRTELYHPMPVLRAFIGSLRETIERVERYEDKHWSKWPGVFNEQVCKGKYQECPYIDRCVRGT